MNNQSAVDSQTVTSHILLYHEFIFGIIGLLTNIYSFLYVKKFFNLSKIPYQLLMYASMVNITQLTAVIIAALWLFMVENELGCIIFQIAVMAPKFIIQCYVLQITILRFYAVFTSKNPNEVAQFQRLFTSLVSPLPYAYMTIVLIIRLSQQKPLGYLHQVSEVSIHKKQDQRNL